MLNKQVQIYSIEGHYFYTENENKIYNEVLEQRNIISAMERFELYKKMDESIKKKFEFNSYEQIKSIYEMKYRKGFSDEEKKLYNSKKYIKRYFTQLERKYSDKLDEIIKELKEENQTYQTYIEAVKMRDLKSDELKKLLKTNKDTRRLDESKLSRYDIVSLFSSNLTRVMELELNKFSKELIIVEITHHVIMEQLIEKGFEWENEHYVFLTSSAGQIRDQKIVMIKETTKDEIIDQLTNGLTLEIINDKKCNVNKYLAYLALNNSATDVWDKFSIDECIVIKDFETEVTGEVDYIGTTDVKRKFEKLDSKGNPVIGGDNRVVTEIRTVKALLSPEREVKTITINHSDGCGWILPELSKVSFMCRLPWLKGLLTPVDYLTWIEKYNNGNYKVTDIWNKEWDLKKDNIKIIFTKSQFKMWKFYKGWDDYKKKFKKNKCNANKCNVEPSKIKEFKIARFNYQMAQSLVGMKKEELEEFLNPIRNKVESAYTDRKTQLEILGVTEKNKQKTNFQKALLMYPQLLKDRHVKEELSDKITAIKNEARECKFEINSTYTYIIPDVFAWMEYIFKGNKNPKGLLKDGQVYCGIYKKEGKLLVNRSPALGAEHAVRENYTGYVEYEGEQVLLSDWFTTLGVYTSCHDLISKLLQFDCDGDKGLVIKGKLVDIAEREMKALNARPVYYEMSKAPDETINNDSIIKSLKSAFKFGNIGKYSNKLTKIWNSEERDMEVIKMLTALNNFYIDGAKTNYCPEVYSTTKDEVKDKKIKMKIDKNEIIENLKKTQNAEKKEILKDISDKEVKKERRKELNEKYGKEIAREINRINEQDKKILNMTKEQLNEVDMCNRIKKVDKYKLPYFFKYAKGYNTSKLEEINDSTVNKACKIVDEFKVQSFDFGSERFNWHYLANNFKVNLESEMAIKIIEQYEILNNRMQSYFINSKDGNGDDDNITKVGIAARAYSNIRDDFEKVISELGVSISDATDIIVRYIYKNKKDCKKTFLFDVLGDVILKNIEHNIEIKSKVKKAKKGHIYCSICGTEVKKESNNQKMCAECAKNLIRLRDRQRKAVS